MFVSMDCAQSSPAALVPTTILLPVRYETLAEQLLKPTEENDKENGDQLRPASNSIKVRRTVAFALLTLRLTHLLVNLLAFESLSSVRAFQLSLTNLREKTLQNARSRSFVAFRSCRKRFFLFNEKERMFLVAFDDDSFA